MKRIHMCLDVRGAIHNGAYRKEMVGSCTDPKTGKKLNSYEILEYLLDCVAEGKQVIPLSDCDNFSFETGCGGHEVDVHGELMSGVRK